MAHGNFVWNELMTTDVAKAKSFYAATVGWTFEDMPMADGAAYVVCKQGDKAVGGIMDVTTMQPGAPPMWFAYLDVDDVDARVARVAAAGGKVIRPPFDIPGIGRIAIIEDATGAALGIMTAAAWAQG
ncbi:MAG: VOC family protein [Methylobacteriaceae bacterium]|nr:VOC family protein [Methylobacteriaceae bacterium]